MIPKYSLLSQAEVEQIHAAALEILDSVGVRVDDPACRALLKKAGGREEGVIVKLGPAVVDQALSHCRPGFSVFHRNSDQELVFGDGLTKFSPTGWTADLLDWRTGEYRQAKTADQVEAVKICGAREEISCFMAPYICTDVPADQIELQQYKVGVENSDKPIIVSASDRTTLDKIHHLAAVLAGGRDRLAERPDFMVNLGLLSPLYLPAEVCEVIVGCAELGVPMCLYTSATAGGTGPVTLSGVLAGNHAELLAANTLAKLLNPELGLIYSSYSKSFDMRHTDVLSGNPEYSLLKAAAVQLGEFIGLPTGVGMLFTDSPRLDIQAGLEKMGGSLLTALCRPDMSAGMGMLTKLMVFSLECLVMDAESVAYFRRLLEGFKVDEERLAVEVFQQTGPAGEFMTSPHTFRHFKEELWYSNLYNRLSFSSWDAKGRSISLESRVKDYLKTTLAEYRSPGLPDRFIKEFERLTV